jgi:hypothetical protein
MALLWDDESRKCTDMAQRAGKTKIIPSKAPDKNPGKFLTQIWKK